MPAKFKFRRGFSFVEILVYMGILSLMTIVVINGLIYFLGTYRDFKSAKDLADSAIVSLDRLSSDIRAAESIDLAGSFFGASPGRLSLNLDLPGSGPSKIEFFVTGGALYVSEDGVSVGSLTASSTSVASLIFGRIATPVSEGVKIDFTLQAGSGADLREESFSATVILRGSYLNR